MHLNSTQEEVLPEEGKVLLVKDAIGSSNGDGNLQPEKIDEDVASGNEVDGIESLVECCMEQDDDKVVAKAEDISTLDAVDESALDCTVKNSPTASGDQDDKKSVPKIKVKDNLLESKPYEKNSLVEKIKLMEESNSLDETGAVSDEDNLMIDINPADVQCVQDDKDSESSQDSVEFRLTHRKNKRKSNRNLREQEEISFAAKKFKRQIEQTFNRRDKVIKDYFQKTESFTASTKENIKHMTQHMELIMNEIRQLNDLIRQKEQEWNELVYLQKAKEELLIRLSRKRDVMLMRIKVDDGHNTSSDLNDLTMLNSNCSNNAVSLTNILSKSMFPNYFSNAAPVNGEVTNKIEPQVNHFANNVHNGVTVLPVNNSGSNFQAKIQLPPQAHTNNIIKNGPMNHFNNLGNINHNQFMLNQQLNSPINGRQGLVKDVKSIIADYRQQHPEVVPKRGRRMKSVLQSNNVGIADGANDANRLSELGLLLSNNEMGSRPSSSESNDNMLLRNQHFQLNSDNGIPLSLMNDISRTSDISLHPINGNLEDTGKQQSLLHGILSKKSQRTTTSTSDSNAYTSTLARLLTAPERNSSNTSINHLPSTLAERLGGNISNRKTMTVTNERSKRRCTDEVTITPIDNRPAVESNEVKEEPKDSGEHHIEININGESAVTEENGDEEEETPPACQGCNKSEAHYVCAGCANQWYCSRECQVNAWEVHSEVCKG